MYWFTVSSPILHSRYTVWAGRLWLAPKYYYTSHFACWLYPTHIIIILYNKAQSEFVHTFVIHTNYWVIRGMVLTFLSLLVFPLVWSHFPFYYLIIQQYWILWHLLWNFTHIIIIIICGFHVVENMPQNIHTQLRYNPVLSSKDKPSYTF